MNRADEPSYDFDRLSGLPLDCEIDALRARLELLSGKSWYSGDVEQDLRAQRALLRTVLDESPDLIVMKDHEGNFLLCNKPVADFYGTTPEDMVGKHDGDYSATPEQAEFFRRSVLDIMARGQTMVVFEDSTDDRTGETRHFKSIKKPFLGDNGLPRILVIAHDITDIRQAQQKVQESERRLSYVLSVTGEAVWDWDLQSNRLRHNQRWYELLGYDKADLSSTFADFDICLFKEERDDIMAAINRCLQGDGPYRHEHRMRRKDGTVIWALDRGDVVERDAQGRPLRMVGSFSDVSERKLIEGARDAMEAQLRELQKMEAIGTLAGGIAHDFNNFIATMLGNAELARRSLDHGHAALQSIDEIMKAGRRARDLVRQILTFSRRQVTDMAPIALGPLVHEVVQMLSSNLPAKIHIEVNTAADAPLIHADSTQMMQVLMNLGTNAIQAMREHGGTLHFAVEASALSLPASEGLGYRVQPALRLTVRDSGAGMDQATLDRMFEPFFTTKPPGEGTGLGLAVVHGVVQSHGGLVNVSSKLGEGTSFTIDLPAACGVPDAGQQVDAAPQGIAPTPTKSGAGRHILYLDDDDSLIFLVRRLLEIEGFKVSAFSEQSEAIAAVAADGDAFDLVITDFNMPGMNGIEVIREMLTINPALKTAIASGFIDEALTEAAREEGVTRLIFKESAIEDFCAVIRGLIEETS
jgi:PAS domain S-box-containing protein